MRVIDCLGGSAGEWTGVNEFRLMPTDATEPLDSTARVDVVAGNGVTFAYTWTHPVDGPQRGYLFLFDDSDGDGTAGVWLDTWHQSPGPMHLRGTADETGARLSAPYATESEWTITIAPGLRLVMDNHVGPEYEPYAAMAAEYTPNSG